MFNSDMLDVAIGVVFVYLLFSLVATAMRESLESWLKSRGVLLEKGILQLLTGPSPPSAEGATSAPAASVKGGSTANSAEVLLAAVYRSTPIFSLYKENYDLPSKRGRGVQGWGKAVRLPAYIPARSFAEGLIEVVHGYGSKDAGGAQGSLDRLRLALEAVPNAPVRDAVRAAIRAGDGDPDAVSRYIEAWYSSVMDRVSGWYRRRTQWWVLGGSAVVAVALNINTITIVQRLSENSALRAAIVNSASKTSGDNVTLDASADTLAAAINHVHSVGLPIGWGPEALDCPPAPKQTPAAKTTPSASVNALSCSKGLLGTPQLSLRYAQSLSWTVLVSSPGWIMTALAISLGAPFWFDVLNKFMIVRTTVKPHEKSLEEGSKDPTSDSTQDRAATGRKDTGDTKPPPPPPPKAAPPMSVTAVERAEIAALDPDERPREDDQP